MPAVQEISVVSETIRSSQKARNIAVTYDNHVLFNDHVASICKSSFYHLRNISYIRKYLSSTTTEILVHAFISSKLDNCNSLLYRLPNYQVKKVTARPERRCSSHLSFKKTWTHYAYFVRSSLASDTLIVLSLKFYWSPTRLLTILLHPIFAIYSHLTFRLVNYVHRLKIFLWFLILIWKHTVQDLFP